VRSPTRLELWADICSVVAGVAVLAAGVLTLLRSDGFRDALAGMGCVALSAAMIAAVVARTSWVAQADRVDRNDATPDGRDRIDP
jgi:hypothetical protein